MLQRLNLINVLDSWNNYKRCRTFTNFVKNSLIQQVYETEAMYLDVYDIKYLLSLSETIPKAQIIHRVDE